MKIKRTTSKNDRNMVKASHDYAELFQGLQSVYALHRLCKDSVGRYWLARIAAKLHADLEFMSTKRFIISMNGIRIRRGDEPYWSMV